MTANNPLKVIDGAAIVSGGMDSVTLLHDMVDNGIKEVRVISFDYGQRHKKELEFAAAAADRFGFWHSVVDLTGITVLIGNSALTGDTDVPEGHYAEDSMKQTVVPNRNMMMLSVAAAIAVNDKASFLGTGVHAGDHFVYPDCRPEFINLVQDTLRSGNEGFINPDFTVYTPFIFKTKADIVARGHELGVPFEQTWSCYKGGDIHCGKCGTCVERAEAFYDAGVIDPTEYEDANYWYETTKQKGKK